MFSHIASTSITTDLNLIHWTFAFVCIIVPNIRFWTCHALSCLRIKIWCFRIAFATLLLVVKFKTHRTTFTLLCLRIVVVVHWTALTYSCCFVPIKGSLAFNTHMTRYQMRFIHWTFAPPSRFVQDHPMNTLDTSLAGRVPNRRISTVHTVS